MTVEHVAKTDKKHGEPSPMAAGALERATERLLALQHENGWWQGELQTNVTMDAEDLLLREFLGVRTEEQTRQSASWIRSQQRPDGTWANFYGGPGDLSTTIESYAALRLAGDPPDGAHMRAAATFILDGGGIERSRVFTRLWLALFGMWPWEDLPVLPPEMIFLPHWFPLNIYDFACWARQTIVALTVVSAFRPVRPTSFTLDELKTGLPPEPIEPLRTWAGRFQRLDQALHAYQRRPLTPLRRAALRRAGKWILERQEADGGWGGIQPPWVYSLIALDLLGYPPDHPALLRAADWVLGEEIRVRGDWAVRRPKLPPGGWAFEFANDNYPDIDDTAEVVLALRRVAHPDSSGPPDLPEPEHLDAAIARGAAWTIGMRSRNGAWGAFDADNTSQLPLELPFCDFGAVTDPPSADVTAHVVEMLAELGMGSAAVTRGGIDWLLREQEADGSWFGRWGVNHLYGTGAALPALEACGVPHDHPAYRAAVGWLDSVQQPSGAFGEDIRSYADPSSRGRGAPTASQTAWALLAYVAAGESRRLSTRRAADYLSRIQRPNGDWDEQHFTGTGFPLDFMIRYHLYRLTFPLLALGRLRERLNA